MKKASEYRAHAAECRQLASKMDLGEQRDQLLGMARHWDDLARDRASLIAKHPELAMPGEHEEDGPGTARRPIRRWGRRAFRPGKTTP